MPDNKVDESIKSRGARAPLDYKPNSAKSVFGGKTSDYNSKPGKAGGPDMSSNAGDNKNGVLGNTSDRMRNSRPTANQIDGFGAKGASQGMGSGSSGVLGNTVDVKRNPVGKNAVKGFAGGGTLNGKV